VAPAAVAYGRCVRAFTNGLSPTSEVAPAAVLTVVGIGLTIAGEGSGGDTWLDTLAIPFLTVPVAWRRRAPAASVAAVAIGMVLSGIPTFDQTRCAVALPAAMLVLFSLAARAGPDRSLPGAALLFAGLAFVGATDPVLGGLDPGFLSVAGGLLAVAWAGGAATGSRRRLGAELAERSRLLEHRREQTAQLAVEVERTRLAGALDAAGRRSVQEIVELAAAHAAAPAGDEAAARGAFARIETAARGSLNEMRSLLGALRSDQLPSLQPRPTLSELDAVLTQARAHGRDVRLDVRGEQRPLSDGVELAAYRMVQHGLAAVGSATEVCLSYGSEAVELQVRGSEVTGAAAEEALAAARERAAAFGGSLSVEAPAPGRRVFRASLPLAVATHG